jgi:predicted transcriptional regulator YdeE
VPALNVSRSISIAQPVKSVRKNLTDFRQWPAWSPWLCQERDAHISFHGDSGEIGSGYAWEGKRVGAGEMQLRAKSDKRIDYELTFLKPWKSRAKVAFELEAQGKSHSKAETRVTWSMQSSLPFFLFFMRKSFENFVGMDYDRGLRMLKEQLESGKISSRIDLADDVRALPGCYYIGQEGSSTLAEMAAVMGEVYVSLNQQVVDQGLEADGPAFCHYTRMDMMRDRWVYTMGIPVKATEATHGIAKRDDVSKCAYVEHTGSYMHLGNAWATVFGAIRARQQKHDRRSGGFEIYRQAPSDETAGDAITDIYLPLK